MIPNHLLPSYVKVTRAVTQRVDGVMTASWQPVAGYERLRCRIEVGFYRPGKDAPLPVQAGRAPDRPAVYWFNPGVDLRPGDHLECVAGPVTGVWELKTFPDQAVGMGRLEHIEGQAIEVSGTLHRSAS